MRREDFFTFVVSVNGREVFERLQYCPFFYTLRGKTFYPLFKYSHAFIRTLIVAQPKAVEIAAIVQVRTKSSRSAVFKIYAGIFVFKFFYEFSVAYIIICIGGIGRVTVKILIKVELYVFYIVLFNVFFQGVENISACFFV